MAGQQQTQERTEQERFEQQLQLAGAVEDAYRLLAKAVRQCRGALFDDQIKELRREIHGSMNRAFDYALHGIEWEQADGD